MPKEQRAKDRESGTGRGKEVAKHGAGGKFTWGSPGMDDAKPVEVSKGDPNFDEDADAESKHTK